MTSCSFVFTYLTVCPNANNAALPAPFFSKISRHVASDTGYRKPTPGIRTLPVKRETAELGFSLA